MLACMGAVHFASAAGLEQTRLWGRDTKILHLLPEEL